MSPQLLLTAFFGLVFSLITALFLRAATRLVAGFTPTYGSCYLAAGLGTLASIALSALFHVPMGVADPPDPGKALLAAVLATVLQVILNTMLITDADHQRVNLGQGCLVSILTTLIAIGVAIVIGLTVSLILYQFDKGPFAAKSRSSLVESATPSPSLFSFLPGQSARSPAPRFAKGQHVVLVRTTKLYLNDSSYRLGNAGEIFEVAEYRSEKRRVYLLSRHHNGQIIALNVHESEVAPK